MKTTFNLLLLFAYENSKFQNQSWKNLCCVELPKANIFGERNKSHNTETDIMVFTSE